MRNLAPALALIAVATTAVALAVTTSARSDEIKPDRLQLAIADAKGLPDKPGARLTVSGTAGRYDRLVSTAIALPLVLTAAVKPEAAGVKILKSELFLKAEGTGPDAARVDTLAGSPPVKSIAVTDAHTLSVTAQGPLAQNAFAACQAAARDGVGTATMPLPVVWLVTTGRSTFKWTNYDQVAPSDDMLNNRDFYSDHDIADVEALLNATLHCEPLAGAAVAAVQAVPAKANAVKPSAAVTPVSTPARLTTASLPEPVSAPVRPQCDGGMVRQVEQSDAGFVCLCPGNTERIATGANAFACEKRNRRR